MLTRSREGRGKRADSIVPQPRRSKWSERGLLSSYTFTALPVRLGGNNTPTLDESAGRQAGRPLLLLMAEGRWLAGWLVHHAGRLAPAGPPLLLGLPLGIVWTQRPIDKSVRASRAVLTVEGVLPSLTRVQLLALVSSPAPQQAQQHAPVLVQQVGGDLCHKRHAWGESLTRAGSNNYIRLGACLLLTMRYRK